MKQKEIKCSFLLAILSFLWIGTSYSQDNNSLGNWMLSVNAGVEKHDKRLFDFPSKERLLEMQSENWGTYHLGIQVSRILVEYKGLNVFLGSGFTFERATFRRPFDHRHFEGDIAHDILAYQNRYDKISLSLAVPLVYQIQERLYVTGGIHSNLLLFRGVGDTDSGSNSYIYKEGTLELDEVSVNLGLGYKAGALMFGLRVRTLNVQKIDKVIFNRIIRDPRTDQKWEWQNPLRFDLSVGYFW